MEWLFFNLFNNYIRFNYANNTQMLNGIHKNHDLKTAKQKLKNILSSTAFSFH